MNNAQESKHALDAGDGTTMRTNFRKRHRRLNISPCHVVVYNLGAPIQRIRQTHPDRDVV